MLRTILILMIFLFLEIAMLPVLIIIKVSKIIGLKKSKIVLYKLVKIAAKIIIFASGVKLEIKGEKKLEDEAYLFISNHQSIFDILFIIAAVEMPIGFIAKKELVFFPILRLWMKELGCIFIDRKNIKESINEINNAVTKLKNGNSLVVFPEGTRSLDGEVGRFKAGSLKLAINSKVSVVPIAISGAHKILKKGEVKIKSGKALINIGNPVCFFDYGNDNSIEISEKIRKNIEKRVIV